jgi:signal transduction histidine kinase/ActR/RegA family two-component response regulator
MDKRDTLIASLQSQLKTAQNNEHRLNTLIQSAPLCIHEINLTGQIISMNSAGLNMMNMQNENEICGIYYIDFVCQKQKQMIRHLLDKAFEGEYSSFEFNPENTALTFASCFAPIVNNDGSIDKVMGITENVTQQKQNEEELLKARKLKSIGVLAGGIAHDFNNILTGMFGHLELAKLKLAADHPVLEHIIKANQAMDTATNLTNQLLTFAKGGDPLKELLDTKKVIENSVTLSLSGSNAKTTLTMQQELWMLNADKGQLAQVITNILINAIQAMPDGGLITIDATNVDQHSKNIPFDITENFVCLKITDQGEGIPEKLKSFIFDPYFTTKKSGSGLGLATTYSIIEKHKGHIYVESTVGKGTTFIIYLPAAPAGKLIEQVVKADKNLFLKPTANILIMDDEEMILEVSTQMIESLGYNVETALCGREAIEKYTNSFVSGKPFDVVIMDLTVPGGKGGELAIKELIAINPQIKAIVSSGYSTSKVMSAPAEYGFQDRLVKPFTMQTLEDRLAKILE